MTFLKRRKNKTQTRIVRRTEETVPSQLAPVRIAVTSVLETQRWDPNQGEFRGFGSPPGKF